MRNGKVHLVLASAFWAVPVFATCTPPKETVLPNAQIVLVSPSGKQLQRTSDANGMLALTGLRKGVWQVRLATQSTPISMDVVRNRKLRIQSVTVRYSCSAPGGPVNHNETANLKQIR
jgi:hypothetical protein